MKKVLSKIADIIEIVFGYGMMLSLFFGGISFLGYLVALIVGGEAGTAICTFIYKTFYPILIYRNSLRRN